ncbi:19423_t:CDS:1 [Cetraspora pellucida]|uniref:19423_t:CDS:1 n=1 Tax=Cetraspora pellucida TaxID=1433469 RepID=A0A9N9DPM7_9GLOM|nr:19423_t:CDS:1 [Cetraspora pellucida]
MSSQEDEFTSIKKLLKNLSNEFLNPPAILLMCGNFNPIHNHHIQMFENAKLFLKKKYEIVAGYISPSSAKWINGKYKDKERTPFQNRKEMIEKVLEESSWIEIDTWQALYSEDIVNCYQVINRLEEFLNKNNQIQQILNQKQLNKLEIIYICGLDEIFINDITNLKDYKIIIFERYFNNEQNQNWKNECENYLNELYNDKWTKFQHNVSYIDQDENSNNFSSTQIRTLLKQKNDSWQEMCHSKVTKYLLENDIFKY